MNRHLWVMRPADEPTVRICTGCTREPTCRPEHALPRGAALTVHLVTLLMARAKRPPTRPPPVPASVRNDELRTSLTKKCAPVGQLASPARLVAKAGSA